MAATFEPQPQSRTSFVIGTVRTINQGSLKALVEVKFGAIVISGFRVVEAPQSRPYVQLPQAQYLDKATGRSAFAPLLRITDTELAEQLKAAVLLAWQRQAHASPPSLFTDDQEVSL